MTSDTPETNAIIREAMKLPTMTGTILAARLTLKCEKLERERDQSRKLFESSKRARKSLSDACDFLQAANRELLPCQWQPNEDGQWTTDCGEMFEFTNDGPTENGFKFCPFCGNSISSLPPANENATH